MHGNVEQLRGAARVQPAPQNRASGALRCRRKFLRLFPEGFRDPTYLDFERDYKWTAHKTWNETLDRATYRALLRRGAFGEIAARAVRVESRTNLLFSFEKMALRDAVRSPAGARAFSRGLYDFLHAGGRPEERFTRWVNVVAGLPRRQTRVLTWPIVSVFGFIALPDSHIFLKPNVTRIAARRYDFDFRYESRPGWQTYASLLDFAAVVRRDLRDLRPRDLIDVQSFIWVQGSDEYAECRRRSSATLSHIAGRADPRVSSGHGRSSSGHSRTRPTTRSATGLTASAVNGRR